MGRTRSLSFDEVDHDHASDILANVIRENEVFLGGSSVGKGLKTAANYYLKERVFEDSSEKKLDHFQLPGAQDLCEDVNKQPLEEAFYVVDIGVLISQIYQWRKLLPRVEPFYAVKCNPDPVVVKTLAILGCNFDCASRAEIQLVQEISKDLPRKPEIIYANPCKARAHLLEAVCRGVRMVTYDNVAEVRKCAQISKKIQLVLRIITDDRGAQCRLSSKFGAPRYKWRPLLAAAKRNGLEVVGVSFHVGSGCHDASRYEMALKDAKEIFGIAEREFGFKMSVLDVGGGFPGETYSMWNPAMELDNDDENETDGKLLDDDDDEDDGKEGKEEKEEQEETRFMSFAEIAEEVVPVLDELFPKESGIRIIGEPGRYFVAAAATLCCSVISSRSNELDTSFEPDAVDDKAAAETVYAMTRDDEKEVCQHKRSNSVGKSGCLDDAVMNTIQEELADYSVLFASQQLVQQEVDCYNDALDLYKEGFETSGDLLGPPDEDQMKKQLHTVEGMTYPLVAATGATGDEETEQDATALLTLAAAGEAAVSGMVLQAVADSSPLQDDYAYYINDGVYGAFNNLMFDHASVRARVLRHNGRSRKIKEVKSRDGFKKLEDQGNSSSDEDIPKNKEPRSLYASTVFGPTCDSIDVIARSVLLPKLNVGDWMYFENMGAYTMAAASEFNGFAPSERFYVCSIPPEYFKKLIKGPEKPNMKAIAEFDEKDVVGLSKKVSVISVSDENKSEEKKQDP